MLFIQGNHSTYTTAINMGPVKIVNENNNKNIRLKNRNIQKKEKLTNMVGSNNSRVFKMLKIAKKL